MTNLTTSSIINGKIKERCVLLIIKSVALTRVPDMVASLKGHVGSTLRLKCKRATQATQKDAGVIELVLPGGLPS